MSPADTTPLSREAHQALLQHAAMFETLGMSPAHESENSILLKDNDLSFSLEYAVQRRLLSRIYTLRLAMEITPASCGGAARYRLSLKAGGLARASHTLGATGPAADEGRILADTILASGSLDELAGVVDLEKLFIIWDPGVASWRVVLEPYPGSHIHVLLPAIRYTVRLQEAEVEAMRDFLTSLSGILRRSIIR